MEIINKYEMFLTRLWTFMIRYIIIHPKDVLKYSKKLNGIVLFYKLKGYHNTFPIIKGSGDILVKCILRIFVEEFEDKKIYKVEGNRIFNFYDVEIANKDAEISNNDMEIDEGDNENYFVRIKSIKQKESMFPIFECERL